MNGSTQHVTAQSTSARVDSDAAGGTPARLARFDVDGEVVTGIVLGDEIVEIESSWTEALAAFARGRGHELSPTPGARRVALTEAVLEMPLRPGSEVYCVGLNYRAHQAEAAELVDEIRAVPIIFVKSYRSMVRPADELALPQSMSLEFDWEVELGVVIGREAIDIAPEDAWDHVAGYCVVNDITARDVQKRHQQWHLGKNAPHSTPIGPWIVERDAFEVPVDVGVRLLVNGVEKQNSRTSMLIHGVPELISLLSATTTLHPGDVIATGTPAGVGFVRQPPEFLQDGDVIETIVEGVGTLTNVVRTPATPGPLDESSRANGVPAAAPTTADERRDLSTVAGP